MRIIITETQLKKVLLYETKQEVITDEYLDKAKEIVTKLQNRGFGLDAACAMAVDGRPCIEQPDVNQARARKQARQYAHVPL